MSTATPPTARDPAGPSEDRPTLVGKLDADRLCRTCMHQLAGQQVYRDARLCLLYIRCPECGTHAAVTEFPIAGRWVRRFGTLIVVLFVLLTLAVLSLDVGFSSVALYEAGEGSLHYDRELLQVEAKKLAPPSTNQQTQQRIDSWWAPPELITATDVLAALKSDPAAQRARWRGFFTQGAVPAVLVAIVSGAVWSGLLLHRRLRLIWVWLLIPSALSLAITLFAWWMERISLMDYGLQNGTSYNTLAFIEFAGPLIFAGAGIMLAVRLIAFLVARPILKGLGALVLPVKIRRAVAELWCDGAPPIVE